jgi:hypothetical protein
MTSEQYNLPTNISDNIPVCGDGFDDVANNNDRLIQGTILKFDAGTWTTREGTTIAPDLALLALDTNQALQCWKDQTPVETIIKRLGEALPDIDELNAEIPESEWDMGLDGKPREPWQLQHIVYLMNPVDAEMFTAINSTIGMRIAVEDLAAKVHRMRFIKGGLRIRPMVVLKAKPMKTRFGLKQRPHFEIIEWRDLAPVPAAPTTPIAPPTSVAIGAPVNEPTLAEELKDSIPH